MRCQSDRASQPISKSRCAVIGGAPMHVGNGLLICVYDFEVAVYGLDSHNGPAALVIVDYRSRHDA